MISISAYHDPARPERSKFGAVRIEFISVGIGPLNDGYPAGVKRAVHAVEHWPLSTGINSHVPKFGDRDWGIARIITGTPVRVYWGDIYEDEPEDDRWLHDHRSMIINADLEAPAIEEIAVRTGDGLYITPVNALLLDEPANSGSNIDAMETVYPDRLAPQAFERTPEGVRYAGIPAGYGEQIRRFYGNSARVLADGSIQISQGESEPSE